MMKSKKLIALMLAAVMVFALVFTGCGANGSPKNVAKEFIEATIKGDAEGMYKLTVNKYMENSDDYDKDETMEGFEMLAEMSKEALEAQYGENLKIKGFKATVEKWDKDEVEELAEEFAEAFDCKDNVVKDAATVECEYTIVGDDGDEEVEESITAYKVGGKWYIRVGM